MTTYPDSPGFAKGSATSEAAADELTNQTALQDAIVRHLKNAGDAGLIVDEALIHLQHDFGRTFDRSTVAARFTELEMQYRIRRTDDTRKTPRNRQAYVYVWHNGTAYEIKKSPRASMVDDLTMCRNFMDGLEKSKVIPDSHKIWRDRLPEIRDLMDSIIARMNT